MNCASSKNKSVSKKTLDSHHNEKVNGFLSKSDKIKALQASRAKLQKQVASYEKRKQELDNDEFEKYMCLQDDLSALNNEIASVEKSFDEVGYYVDSAQILFKYYDILEKGQQEDTKINISSNSILKYFMPQPQPSESSTNKTDDRASLLDKYMFYNSSNYFKEGEVENKDRCQFCDSCNRTVLISDGLIFCNDCYTIENIIIDHDRPSYKDPPKEISYFAYLCLWAKESSTITIRICYGKLVKASGVFTKLMASSLLH